MKKRFSVLLIVLVLFAAGCTMRPGETFLGPAPSPTPAPTPAPTPVPEYSVTFRAGEDILSETSVLMGEYPTLPTYESSEFVIVGWENALGKPASPDQTAVTADSEYRAILRPALRRDVRFVFADKYGLFRPEDLWSRADAARAFYTLMPETPEQRLELLDVATEAVYYDACSWFSAMGYAELTDFDGDGSTEFGPEQPVDAEYFAALLTEFFAPDTVDTVVRELPAGDAGLTRARATQWLCALLELDTGVIHDRPYCPDVVPAHEASGAIAAAAAHTGCTAEDFSSKTLDGFLWFDGYLYAWDEEAGHFHTDTTLDTLYYDKNGRYTSGNTELDGYVAALIEKRCDETMDRRKMLESMHKFLRDENMYLVRNRYEPGATGWEIDEALIMLSTGKGNCYSFAGALWALGRGLGYNTVTYSGTISKNYDPHGWTEIILDGVPYICDPEIQKQYWAAHKYYDTFMLPYDQAIGWQYEAPNRPV